MSALKKILKAVLIFFLISAVFLFFYLPTLATTGKSRGNRLAQLDCRMYLIAASSTKTNGSFFEFSKLSSDERRRALCLAIHLDLLVKTNFVWSGTSNRLIVAVCPREFDNVPEPILLNLYHKNPAHAVGYSDGTIGLISPTQFTNLNLSGFESAARLATNSEFNIFKN